MKLNTILLAILLPLSLNAQDDHDHAEKGPEITGPNQGRILHEAEPHAEFFVTKDRKIQITFITDEGKKIPLTTQKVTIILGDRANPTTMKLEEKDGALLSTNAVPEGDDFPTIVTIKTSPDTKPVRERFTLDFSDCPTCVHPEYACTCGH